MFCKSHKCIVLVCGILSLAGFSASAEDKKDDKAAPSGTWVRKEGELKLEFDGKGELKIAPHGDSKTIAIVCDATKKDGRIKVKVTGAEGSSEEAIKKVKEHLPAGTQFSFKWTVKGDSAKLDDIKGEGDIAEHLKSHLEGDYEKK
ncbi:MAG TPA: hypothetical protein VE999_18145 [Gemmataceae bacterium]|nr:hypothetical protein [Gemmataceae bacterium]